MADGTDLSFATSEDLFHEIAKRCKAVVIVIEARTPKGDGSGCSLWFDGGFITAIGLVESAKLTLNLMQSNGWAKRKANG